MSSSDALFNAERNARLLSRLAKQFETIDLGKISNFFEVAEDWRCPCCSRSKEDFARRDKNNNLLCELHRHHDHFTDEVCRRLPRDHYDQTIVESFSRFPPTLLCSDCNVAEPVAKRMAGTPEYFTFAPFEIATFIKVRKNLPHIVDDESARAAYEAAKPGMILIRNRLQALLRSITNQDEDFEHVGGSAWRALKDIRAKMKEAK